MSMILLNRRVPCTFISRTKTPLNTTFKFCGPASGGIRPTKFHAVQEKQVTISNEEHDIAYDGPSKSKSSSNRVVLESEDELKSTWQHRLYVGSTTALLAATLCIGVSHIQSFDDALWGVAALFLAYVLSDLGTAFYHWGVDNYGDANTPLFGGQIAAFQGHHQRPWTITERQFCNNVHKVFAPAAPVSAVLLVISFFAPSTWSIWSSVFLFLACMSQQFHAWSHMKASELHPLVVKLQDAGVLISRKAHGAHHKSPFNGNYSIVSGWWNPVLDGKSAETSFYRKLEDYILEKYGVEPRSWYEPQEGWTEETRQEA